MGVFHSHNTTTQHRWNGRNLRILQCQTPLHSLCRRLVEAACPVHDTHAAGVVTQANNHIVVALKNPHAPYKRCTKKFSGKVLHYFTLDFTAALYYTL